MKCRQCGKKAVIRLRAHNIALCKEDFLSFILHRVQKTIKTFRLFEPREKTLVAVSGGKDSLGLFDILQRLGYAVEGFHIDMGVNGFSHRAQEVVGEFLKHQEIFPPTEPHEMRDCAICGFPTTREKCQFCTVLGRYHELNTPMDHSKVGKD